MTAVPTNDRPQPLPPAVNAWQADYLEAEYTRFKQDPESVSPDMAAFFRGFDLALAGSAHPAGGESPFQENVDGLIAAYREFGHLAARTDPLGRVPARPACLELASHSLSEADLDRPVASHVLPGRPLATVREVVRHLEQVYCGPLGAEFMHIFEESERNWFLERLEGAKRAAPLGSNAAKEVLAQLTAAETFDKFLGKRYQGKKRFSLEGGESLIPMLKAFTQRAGELGAEEIFLGMPHRGRLSVLRNYLGKELLRLFTEFEDSWSDGTYQGGGDVKYHRGFSGDQFLPDGRKVHLSMINNPSHLESVNAIVMGRCRSKQDRIGDSAQERTITLLIHGDAAIAGQGVVSECLTMSRLEGYTVGGTVHIVVNNLVGFTTDWTDSRSTYYCTDVAKMIDAPVLHVCGDDPDAVVRAAHLAAEYRRAFKKDIFVELVCFRRYGHNEQDEPAYTQPTLYALVRQHPGTRELCSRRLIAEGVITEAESQAMVDAEQNILDEAQAKAKEHPVDPVPQPGLGVWTGFTGTYTFDSPETGVPAETIAEVCAAMGRVPDGFHVHPKLRPLLQSRAALPASQKVSHADAEQIAVGTLLLEGFNVRLSGQDSRRGTFTQRHAVLRDEQTAEKYTSLNHIRPDQSARFSVWDSPLSEYGVLGFDYGYSRGAPRTLAMWEGQFGDFANGAQIMIDQYLAASEVKWRRWTGIVLLLPHGYEGQGPEHSSSRVERFLQLCADTNMEVVYPSTGAQMFHLLRRQMLRKFRKPLIVLTPKRYLRIETSLIEEMTRGTFQHLIDDPAFASSPAKGVTRVIYCSGKIFHELDERRRATGRADIAIVRVEQLYPFHREMAAKINARYPADAQRVWVQEEPRNQGPFLYAADVFREQLGVALAYVGRPPSASPATGSEHAHKDQQNQLLTEAVGPLPATSPGAKTPSNGEATKARAPQPKASKR